MKRVSLVAAATTVLALTACGGAQGGGEDGPVEVTVAITTASLAQKEDVAVFAVGEQLGYYAEEGITISTVNADGSSAAVQAVASGSADVSTPDAGSILGAASTGVPVTAIGGLVQNWPWSIAVPVDSDIRSAEDLEGANIGVISLASGSAPFARAVVDAAGLNPESDVNLLPVGVGAQAASALNEEQVDALALYGQAYTTIEQGGLEFRYLDNPPELDAVRSLTFMVTKAALADDPELWTGFLRASYRALIYSASNPEAAVRLGYEEFPQLLGGEQADDRIGQDVELLQTWIESAIPEDADLAGVSDWGAISEDSWDATQEFSIEAGQIDEKLALAEVWDPSLLEAANDFDPTAVITEANNNG